jgi:hypothetical protein
VLNKDGYKKMKLMPININQLSNPVKMQSDKIAPLAAIRFSHILYLKEPTPYQNHNCLEFGALLGLLMTLRCLQNEMKAFRASPKGSIKEQNLWIQCEKRSLEVEEYIEKLPDYIVDLIMTHVTCSNDRVEELSNQGGKRL